MRVGKVMHVGGWFGVANGGRGGGDRAPVGRRVRGGFYSILFIFFSLLPNYL